MKDEEMAEEYADGIATPDLNDSFRTDIFEASKDGFLAGLKAGRPQWHDLEKEPTDLPKKDGRYWVCYEISTHHRCTIALTYGKYNNSPWFDSVGTPYDKGVIAWCEIPTFDKE